MNDGPFSFSGWEPFLPPNAVLMARRGEPSAAPDSDAHSESTLATAPKSAPAFVRFLFEVPGLESSAERELFEKILGALNLSAADYRVVTDSASATAAGDTLIRFTASDGENVGSRDAHAVTTFSLAAMLRNPGLKKAVWEHLKSALKK